MTFAVLKYYYPDNFTIYTGGEMVVAFLIYFGEGFLTKRSAEKEQEVEELMERLASG